MIDTAIIILHYNNDDLTNQCIDSILKHTPERYQIIVVDNDSDTLFESDRAWVIRNDNRYSVSGMNFGFRYALDKGFKYIVNFDNDIICLDNWLEPLIKVMEEDQKIGIVGGKQWDKEMTHYRSVGSDLVGGHIWGNFPTDLCKVIWIQGSFVLLRAEMMKEIGVHDTRFKTYSSDCDYCIHALDRGWAVVFVPDSNVIHIMNASYGGCNEDTTDDQRKLLQKWFGVKFNALASEIPIDGERFGKTEFKVYTK